jgi:hypothetical protein
VPGGPNERCDLVNPSQVLNIEDAMKKRSAVKKKGSTKKKSAKALLTAAAYRIHDERMPATITIRGVSEKSVSSMMTFAAKYEHALKRLAKR